MANEKRLIDAYQFRGKHEVAEVNGKLCSVICYADIVNAPTVDAVEVVQIERVKQEILQQMDMFIAEYNRIGFYGKSDTMDIARRLVNASLTDLCSNCGAKMDGDGNEN